MKFETKHRLGLLFKSFFWIAINTWFAFKFLSADAADKPWSVFVLVQLFLLFCWAPGVYLYLTYLKKNYKAGLEFDSEFGVFEYHDGSQSVKFTAKDIDEAFIWKAYAFRAPWSGFKYLRIDLKDGGSIWVTCLLTDVEQFGRGAKLIVQEREGVIPTL